MENSKSISDVTAINAAPICINGGCDIVEDMTANAVYNRRIENNLPLPPDKKQFVGALGSNEEFYRFTKR